MFDVIKNRKWKSNNMIRVFDTFPNETNRDWHKIRKSSFFGQKKRTTDFWETNINPIWRYPISSQGIRYFQHGLSLSLVLIIWHFTMVEFTSWTKIFFTLQQKMKDIMDFEMKVDVEFVWFLALGKGGVRIICFSKV